MNEKCHLVRDEYKKVDSVSYHQVGQSLLIIYIKKNYVFIYLNKRNGESTK